MQEASYKNMQLHNLCDCFTKKDNEKGRTFLRNYF